MTSDFNLSLKKGTARAIMSQKRGNSFPENTFGRNRHCCTKISGFWVQNILSDVPKTGKLIPRKHVWPKMGHQCARFGHFYPKMGPNGNKCAFFLLEDFGEIRMPILFRAFIMWRVVF